MSSNWTREDPTNFTRVRNERFPAVLQASRALQFAVGISPGTRMIGKAPVKLWTMPEPPIQTTQEMFASLKVRMGLVSAKQANEMGNGISTEVDTSESESSDESQGAYELLWYPPSAKGRKSLDTINGGANLGEDAARMGEVDVQYGTFGHNEHPAERHIDQTNPLKRKSRNSSSSSQGGHHTSDKKPKIVIDLTDSPDSPPTLGVSQSHSQNELQPDSHSNGSNRYTTRRPASPPPNWVPSSRAPDISHLPANWCHTISKNINRWLEQPGTKSSQISLSQLELRGLANGLRAAPVYISLHAKDYAKVKLSRLTLPPSAQVALAPPQSLDWLVIQVNLRTVRCQDSISSWSDVDMIPLPMGAIPYWLLAFPLQAITDSTVQSQCIPVSPLPPRPQNRKSKRNKTKEEVLHITTLMLGKQGRVPLVHGRGIKPKFAQEFIEACAEGEGVIDLRSLEPLSMMLK